MTVEVPKVGCPDGVEAVETIFGESDFVNIVSNLRVRRDAPIPLEQQMTRFFELVDQAIVADDLRLALAGAVNRCELCSGDPQNFDGPFEGCRLVPIMNSIKEARAK